MINELLVQGMTFMRKFLQKNNYQALHSIGDDAPSIFFEIWYTSADSRIRLRAKSIMTELMAVYERKKVRLTSHLAIALLLVASERVCVCSYDCSVTFNYQ